MLKEINRKIDSISERERAFQKQLETVDKRLGGLLRRVNKINLPLFMEIFQLPSKNKC